MTLFLSQLLLPVTEEHHHCNFDRIGATIRHVLDRHNNDNNHQSMNDDAANGQQQQLKKKKKHLPRICFFFTSEQSNLGSTLTIESIAQYYSEIMSNSSSTTSDDDDDDDRYSIIMSSVIVLPPPPSKSDNETTMWCKYVQYQQQIHECNHAVFIQFDGAKSDVMTSVAQQVPNCTIETLKLCTGGDNNDDDEKRKIWNRYYPLLCTSSSETSDLYGKCHVVCLGGTFDRLHMGHQLLLTCLAMVLDMSGDDMMSSSEHEQHVSSKFVIGLSTDSLLQNKKFREWIQSYEDRRRNVVRMLKTVHVGLALVEETDESVFQIVELHDPFGPSTTEPIIDALIISEETRSGGEMVNKVRLEQGKSPARLVCIPVLQARNAVEKISSTQLRQRNAERHHKQQQANEEKQ